jgi:hypothetical protein
MKMIACTVVMFFLSACHHSPRPENWWRTSASTHMDACIDETYRAHNACSTTIEWDGTQPPVDSFSYKTCSHPSEKEHVLRVVGNDVITLDGKSYYRNFNCTFDLQKSKVLNYSVKMNQSFL